jgi:hypothetical protein
VQFNEHSASIEPEEVVENGTAQDTADLTGARHSRLRCRLLQPSAGKPAYQGEESLSTIRAQSQADLKSRQMLPRLTYK